MLQESDAQATSLRPHDLPNMLNLFMTRYDYDYGRMPTSGALGGAEEGAAEDTVSGDVHNRPIIAASVAAAFGDGTNSTYAADFVPQATRFDGDVRDLVGAAMRDRDPAEWGTAYAHDKPMKLGGEYLANHFSTYKAHYLPADMGEVMRLQRSAPSKGDDDGEPSLHPGARATSYKSDFLVLPEDSNAVDPTAGLTGKITSPDSLLPKTRAITMTQERPDSGSRTARVPLNLFGGPRDYFQHSTLYGDTTLAHPSQQPRGVAESRNAHLVDSVEDKALLVALLAGRRGKNGDLHTARGSHGSALIGSSAPADDTNPVFIKEEEQEKCCITRRLENEGYVKQTIYQSDFIDQGLLPELPDSFLATAVMAEELQAGANGASNAELAKLRSTRGRGATDSATGKHTIDSLVATAYRRNAERAGNQGRVAALVASGGYRYDLVDDGAASTSGNQTWTSSQSARAKYTNSVYNTVIRAVPVQYRSHCTVSNLTANSSGPLNASDDVEASRNNDMSPVLAALERTSSKQLPPGASLNGSGSRQTTLAGRNRSQGGGGGAVARMCPGDMVEGVLTRMVKQGELLRDTHGFLREDKPAGFPADEWRNLEEADCVSTVDKRGDPNKHKKRD